MSSLPLDQIAIYVEDLRTGLHFSILKFVRNLLDYYCLYPAQLAPNFIWLIISFALLCRLIPTNPQPSLVRAFFLLHLHPKAKGWWFFNPRKDLSFISDLLSSIHGWKNQFFFISSSSSWGFSSSWRDSRANLNKHSRVDVIDREDFLRLKDMEVPTQWELMTE